MRNRRKKQSFFCSNKMIVSILISLLSVVVISFCTYWNGDNWNRVVQIAFLILLFHLLLLLHIEYNRNYHILSNDPHNSKSSHHILKKQECKEKYWILFGTSYFVSLFFILTSYKFNSYHFYLIGSLLIAMFINVNIGNLFTIYFTVIASLIFHFGIERFVSYIMIGFLFNLFSVSFFDQKKFRWICISILSANITLIMINSEFSYTNIMKLESLYSILSTGMLLLIGYMIPLYITKRKNKTNKRKEDHLNISKNSELEIQKNNDLDITKNSDLEIQKSSESEIQNNDEWNRKNKLLSMLDNDNPFIQVLKNNAASLYIHSITVAELSEKAAKEINADALLAKVGGLYHEIGKIKSNDYITEGIELAKKYDFPIEIIDMIKQHNARYEKPITVEATIVMLTDSIVTAMDYFKLKNNSDKKSIEKLLESVFQVRLSKGSLDDSYLTIKDMNKLKEFYIEYYLL